MAREGNWKEDGEFAGASSEFDQATGSNGRASERGFGRGEGGVAAGREDVLREFGSLGRGFREFGRGWASEFGWGGSGRREVDGEFGEVRVGDRKIRERLMEGVPERDVG